MRLKLELEATELNEAVDFFARLFERAPESRSANSAEFLVPGPELNLLLSEQASDPPPAPEACC
jgi:hypothetical protein